jgi:hypothetical protein
MLRFFFRFGVLYDIRNLLLESSVGRCAFVDWHGPEFAGDRVKLHDFITRLMEAPGKSPSVETNSHCQNLFAVI